MLARSQVNNSVIKRRIRLHVCVTVSSLASYLLSDSSAGFILSNIPKFPIARISLKYLNYILHTQLCDNN